MLKKLLSLYPNSFFASVQPNLPFDDYHVFYDESNRDWLGIPKAEISDNELMLLKVMYQLVETSTVPHLAETKIWHVILLGNAPVHNGHLDSCYRLIQFQLHQDQGTEVVQTKIESALKGFFTEEAMIVLENIRAGFVIE